MKPQTIALLQGLYFAMTGIWPIVSISTFQKVTGPKRDIWLVRTVAALIIAIAVVLLYSASREVVPSETFLLAVGSALALAVIDVVYVSVGRISKIYLADAVAEVVLIILWLRVGTHGA